MAYSLDRQVNAYGQVYYRHSYYTPKPTKAVLAQVKSPFYYRHDGQRLETQPGAVVWVTWHEGEDMVTVWLGKPRYVGSLEIGPDGQTVTKPGATATIEQAQQILRHIPNTAQTAPTRPTRYGGQLPQEVK